MALNQDISMSNVQKDSCIREEGDLLSELAKLELRFQQAKDEKNSLHRELEILSGTYNDCRRVLGNEHRDLSHNNNW